MHVSTETLESSYILKDGTGARVDAIAREVRGVPEDAIYSHWVREDVDHSWRKLAQCLRRCGLKVLASDIEEHFGLSPPQQPKKDVLFCHLTLGIRQKICSRKLFE